MVIAQVDRGREPQGPAGEANSGSASAEIVAGGDANGAIRNRCLAGVRIDAAQHERAGAGFCQADARVAHDRGIDGGRAAAVGDCNRVRARPTRTPVTQHEAGLRIAARDRVAADAECQAPGGDGGLGGDRDHSAGSSEIGVVAVDRVPGDAVGAVAAGRPARDRGIVPGGADAGEQAAAIACPPTVVAGRGRAAEHDIVEVPARSRGLAPGADFQRQRRMARGHLDLEVRIAIRRSQPAAGRLHDNPLPAGGNGLRRAAVVTPAGAGVAFQRDVGRVAEGVAVDSDVGGHDIAAAGAVVRDACA